MELKIKNWWSKIWRVIKCVIITSIVILLIGIVSIICIREINTARTKIRTDNGIQESTYVEFGGIKQYINIRGENKDNPVIVFIHGGPGGPMGFIGYYYQRDLEKDYTIVNWDQRGSGRTYYENQGINVSKELSTDILLNDLDNLVDYLAKRLNKDKIIIMGHSWGTVLGSRYSLEHPEKVQAYIGIGQVVNFKKGEILAANTAIERGKEVNDNEFTNELSIKLDNFSKLKNGDDITPLMFEMRE